MRNLINPKWLFVINTLPLVVLIYLFFGQFNIIKTLLNDESIQLWIFFGIWLAALGIANFGYAVFLTIKKKRVSVWYGFTALVFYITYTYAYAYHLDDIMPFSIPRWMLSGNIMLYVGTFLMPTIAHSLFVLVQHFTPEDREHNGWVSFLIAIGVPVVGYLFTQIVFPLWDIVRNEFFIHASLVLLITITLVFLFFLIRSIYILAINKAGKWLKYQLLWKIPISLVLPLLGLLANNGLLVKAINPRMTGVFGDFNNAWFYILAVVNGILICLPNFENKIQRMLLFFGRSITFAYTLYFFLVFLPFLPLSIVAIIAVGTGFLMLTPLALFAIHFQMLSNDFNFLKTQFSNLSLMAIAAIGFLVIPAIITVTYVKDRVVLNETLSYIYSPDYSKNYEIDKESLGKTINLIKSEKDQDNDLETVMGGRIPYLSAYFKWLVLDNLTLSDAKINVIERIFFGGSSIRLATGNSSEQEVELTKIASSSTYDKTQRAWKTWVDMELTNKSEGANNSEYSTTFSLPEGCWISNYYLYVEGEKEFGILAEKRSATWVFSQIRNENRDPGILYYLTGNKIAFKVFPLAKAEVRKTGIELIHKESLSLKIDRHTVLLGDTAQTSCENVETENMVYVSAHQKRKLNHVKRAPYFHFLVDVSQDKKSNSKDINKRIERALKSNPNLASKAKISFVNSYVSTSRMDENWKRKYDEQNFEGGFYLDRAIRMTLINAYLQKNKSYPVIVVVTDSIEKAILDKDFADLKFAFPEGDRFFSLDKNGNMVEHSLVDDPIIEQPEVLRECEFCETVLEYKLPGNAIAYLPNNNEPSIILKNDIIEASEAGIKKKDWLAGLSMQGVWNSYVLHPENSEKEWANLLKLSFVSEVMNPLTSYLVVENDAQKAILKKKQEQALSGNKNLDLSEDSQRMSEPSFIIVAIVLILALWYFEKSKRRLAS